METVILSEFGDSLGTRFLGEEVRRAIEVHLSHGESSLIEFSNVVAITHSFADEVFGELISKLGLEKFKQVIRFSGVSEESRAIIRFAISERLDQAHH
jgi:STAS-like domain of unknown function (DUF4325)